MQKIKFGTDGFRGIIADTFTFDNVARISRAVAEYLLSKEESVRKRGVVVGYDRRFLSDKFADIVAEELTRRGIPVFLTAKAVPTPAVSCYIRQHRLPCGIILTASHNPALFNGFKIKDEHGASASEAVTRLIEDNISKGEHARKEAVGAAVVKKVEIINPYLRLVKSYLNFDVLRDAGFQVMIDAMHGVGSGIIEKVLEKTRCRVTGIRTSRDVLFGGVNPEPILENLSLLQRTVKSTPCDLALSLDGDADRIGAMCPNGAYISSHRAICLLLLHLIENRKMTGKVIKSINTTTMVDKITQHFNLPLEVVPVGFKNIASRMLKEDVLLGGEESGGIGFKNYMPERDGVLSGLLLLELMAYRKQGILEIIRDMERRFGHFVYMRNDLKTTSLKKIPHPRQIGNKRVVDIKTYDGTKFILEDESWLLIRASGTEPIVRIYAESGSIKSTRALIAYGCGLL
ncbi:MAG: phosphoglucomutase/phosphomannomutase family protein [Candidatus Omnitrophica bacterium]|nr:phosphoglucomutase/phosphomannomutase family protein [Candidatus Omnitrophota bacterium]MBU4478151.1 phosphoglucomutase/phosphomannomutase family protein [Candidatus Omnitrophota bacterium]MCG2704052.1 phosphoglucomutase/phosphomannomutase family protein [Candidatus Omnitrophota bacterium]